MSTCLYKRFLTLLVSIYWRHAFLVVTDVSQKVNELIFGQQGTNLPENIRMKYKKHLARFLTKQKAAGCVPYYGSSCVWLGELWDSASCLQLWKNIAHPFCSLSVLVTSDLYVFGDYIALRSPFFWMCALKERGFHLQSETELKQREQQRVHRAERREVRRPASSILRTRKLPKFRRRQKVKWLEKYLCFEQQFEYTYTFWRYILRISV